MTQKRRPRLAVLTFMAMLGAFPTLSWGQLLPNYSLRNHTRTPCPEESPAIKMYRTEYFGYHPTCWRKFPSGWGCPNPEAPNSAASFADRKRDRPNPTSDGSGDLPADNGDLPEMPIDQPGSRMQERNTPTLPPIPGGGGRSPFDLDTNPTTPRGPAGNSPRGTGRPGLDGGPAGGPLDPPNQPSPGASTRTARRRQPTLASNTPMLNVPSLPDPTPPLATGASIDPLPGSIAMPPALGDNLDTDDGLANSSSKATVAKRPGLLTSLFGNPSTRRR